MFEHSVKVPRHYKIAANIYRKAATEGASIKTLLYEDKLRHYRTNVLYALISETIKHTDDLNKIFTHYKIFEKEPRLDPWLAKVLTTELLFGKKSLPGKSKPELTIHSYKDQFEKYVFANQNELQTKVTRKPRYVRVNTNLLTTSDAIRGFQDQGYRFIRCTSGSYSDYLEQINQLTEDDFTQDYHVKTVFVFAAGTKLHDNEFYLNKKIILQDKATTLSVHLLAPTPGSIVLDMCAAPGMKTSQLAAYMKNTGRIYAVERDSKRYETLCEFLKSTGCESVKTINKDVLEIKKGEMNDVEYIILDPSCSGSGMEYSLHNYTDTQERLQKLTSLQEKFLKHAMNSFPSAKRIVYSTCSLYPEENERVVLNVVKSSRTKWMVQNVKEMLKGQWNNCGSGMYGNLGTRCIYARPESDMTIGFFVAVLDRKEATDHKDEIPVMENIKVEKKIADKLEESTESADLDVNNVAETVELDEMSKKVKKKRKKDKENIKDEGKISNKLDERTELADLDVDNVAETVEADEISKKVKKKRKKDKESESLSVVIDHLSILAMDPEEGVHKKKKKKDKDEYEDNIADADVAEEKNSKKRKRKEDRNAIEEVAESQIESESISKKKKHKKSDKAEMVIDNGLEVNEPPKKKKNKKKDH